MSWTPVKRKRPYQRIVGPQITVSKNGNYLNFNRDATSAFRALKYNAAVMFSDGNGRVGVKLLSLDNPTPTQLVQANAFKLNVNRKYHTVRVSFTHVAKELGIYPKSAYPLSFERGDVASGDPDVILHIKG